MRRAMRLLVRFHKGLFMKRKRSRAGMTLIEIMVVLVIMSAIASAVGFAVVAKLRQARKHDASSRARTIQSGAVAYIMERPGDCPGVSDLLKADILDRTTNSKDPWEHDYLIECDGNTVHVRSSGEDGQPGTEDDVGF
jgi:general secretion pathway protein G